MNTMPAAVRFAGSLDPRLHQPEATEAALAALRSGGRCMVAQHTGAGKTVCALAVAAAMGLKTLVVVHKGVLMDQWVERVRTFLPAAKVGKVCQGVCETAGYDVVVAMLQSVERRCYEGLNDHGLLILDEVHRFAAAGFSRILFKVNAPHVLGLSATPERPRRADPRHQLVAGGRRVPSRAGEPAPRAGVDGPHPRLGARQGQSHGARRHVQVHHQPLRAR